VTPVFPAWFGIICAVGVMTGALCALVILADVLRHPQPMPVMNLVWPICALFGTPAVLALYFRGRRAPQRSARPFAIVVAEGTLHCGSGCALGDIVAEWWAFAAPSAAVAAGWHTLFAEKTYAVWLLDFVLAFAFGIAFQYFSIVPMRKLSPGKGLIAALKADALSLAAWQIGMYGAMAFLQFVIFEHCFGGQAAVDSVEFWAAMQVAMIAGFAASYPMNWWLILAGIKERM
jgi:hypothetical protein